ncbi:hypothetical protein L3Q65_00340 (plasmid) [Amycolatopsis sp. FU40]|uniref:hypothetical protein n=1 Tax=Amycolatopsis sp. FU40 TaxID=2914159 RepID=UPI001F34F8BE|nr:hypothetical protein [Amycolatopsis sp. FU40]UKD50778.1 hypothetical protein L3Q65_00340 [Amycolatopsis sp. FU40]
MRLLPPAKIESFGDNPSYPEAVAAIRAEHGRAASHWVADRLGLSQRQARRYLSPQPPNARRPDVVALAPRLRVAEGRLRRTLKTTSGTIEVNYSPSGPTRSVPDIDATAGLRDYLTAAADYLADGERHLAAAEFEQYILIGYGGGSLPEEMSIVAYLGGIDLVLDDGVLTAQQGDFDELDDEDGDWDGEDVPLF